MHTIFLLLTFPALAGLPQFDVRPLRGAAASGRLVGLDGARVTLETPAGRVSLPTDRVASIAARQNPAAPREAPREWVDLTDGSALAVKDFAARDGRARLTLIYGDVVELPIEEVAAVRFQGGAAAAAAEWDRIAGMKLHGDVLVVSKGDSIDYHQGVLHEVTDKEIRFDFDGEVLSVKRDRVFGLIYYHAAVEGLAPLATIRDGSGSRWSARALSLDGALQWIAPGGRAYRRALDEIVEIDMSRGKIVYLSDLVAESAVYTPLLGLDPELASRLQWFRPRQDANLESTPLRIGGKNYAKGLCVHSRTEMTYSLPGRFSRLEAVAGIDDAVRPGGRVRLIVRGDGRLLLDTALAGTEPPRPLSLDLSGIRRLLILADYGDDSDVSGHLDLGDARLIR
jgi:hypothetical protein